MLNTGQIGLKMYRYFTQGYIGCYFNYMIKTDSIKWPSTAHNKAINSSGRKVQFDAGFYYIYCLVI